LPDNQPVQFRYRNTVSITIAIRCPCDGLQAGGKFEAMDTNLSTTPTRELRRGETVSVDGDRRGARLRCLDGQLWITQAGDQRDHLIAVGREFMITRPGRVVIQALSPLARVDAIAA
jgi:hypothetical protein